MRYSCKTTSIENGESKRYATPYSYYKGSELVGRAVLTKKIAGKWKGWHLLSNVIIYPKFRGQGLCKKMLKCIIKKHGEKKVYLEVDNKNLPAVNCYLNCRFIKKEQIGKLIIMILQT